MQLIASCPVVRQTNIINFLQPIITMASARSWRASSSLNDGIFLSLPTLLVFSLHEYEDSRLLIENINDLPESVKVNKINRGNGCVNKIANASSTLIPTWSKGQR